MPAHLPAQAGALGAAPAPPPAAREVYNLPPAANFSFLASPVAWDVLETADGYEVLPVLERFEYYPGQKGVSAVKDPVTGRWVGNPSQGLARKVSRGKIIVPKDWTVQCFDREGKLIAERPDYVHALRGNRGAVHLDVWSRPYKMGDSVFTERDTIGYHVFLRRVRDELLNGGPNVEVRAALRQKLADLVRIAGPKKADDPDVLTIKAKIAALDAPAKRKRRKS